MNHTTSLLFSLSRTVGTGVALLLTVSSVFILVPKAFYLDQRHDSSRMTLVLLFVVLHILPLSLFGSPYLSCLSLPLALVHPLTASHLGLVAVTYTASPMVSIDIFLYLHNCTVSTDCCVLFICKTKLQELGCAWFFFFLTSYMVRVLAHLANLHLWF